MRLALLNGAMAEEMTVALVTNFVNPYTVQRGIAQGEPGFSR